MLRRAHGAVKTCHSQVENGDLAPGVVFQGVRMHFFCFELDRHAKEASLQPTQPSSEAQKQFLGSEEPKQICKLWKVVYVTPRTSGGGFSV